MVIHFCASCDWSVSEQELLTGGAIKLENARVYCARCVQAGLVQLPAGSPARASGLQPGVGTTITQPPRGGFVAQPAARSGYTPAVNPRTSGYVPAVGPARNSGLNPGVAVNPRGSGIAPAVGQTPRGSGITPAVPPTGRTGQFAAVPAAKTGQFKRVGTPAGGTRRAGGSGFSQGVNTQRAGGSGFGTAVGSNNNRGLRASDVALPAVGAASAPAHRPTSNNTAAKAQKEGSETAIILGVTACVVLLVGLMLLFGGGSSSRRISSSDKDKKTEQKPVSTYEPVKMPANPSTNTNSSNSSRPSTSQPSNPASRPTPSPSKTPEPAKRPPQQEEPVNMPGLRSLTEPIFIQRPAPSNNPPAQTQPVAQPNDTPPPVQQPKYPPLLMERDVSRPVEHANAPVKPRVPKAVDPQWLKDWQVDNLKRNAKVEMHEDVDGIPQVLETYPAAQDQALKLQRKVTVPAKEAVLEFAVRANNKTDAEIMVEIEGKKLLTTKISGENWSIFDFDLRTLGGKEITINVEHRAAGWEDETLFWRCPTFNETGYEGAKIIPFDALKLPLAEADNSKTVAAPAIKSDPHEPKANLVVKTGNFKLEYERVLADLHALLYRNYLGTASELVTQALAEPKLGMVQSKLKHDQAIIGLYRDYRKAVLDGANLLADKRQFVLRKVDGKDLELGTGRNTVTGIDGDVILIDQEVGGGKMSQRVPIEVFTTQCRFELAMLAQPASADRSLRLATAGIVALQDGQFDPSPKAIRNHLDNALKQGASAELVEHLQTCVEFQELLVGSIKKFMQIEAAVKEQKWKQAQPLIDAFKNEYRNTFALERVQGDLEQYEAAAAKVNPKQPGVWASYFTLDKAGDFDERILTRAETKLGFEFKDKGPDPKLKVDNFGVRYRAQLNVPKDGTYRFMAIVDGTMTLWIDGKQVVDQKDVKGKMTLKQGNHDLIIDYSNTQGSAALSLKWSPDEATDWSDITLDNLSYDDDHKNAK
ncbi:MAG TPA: PA14 domain-containing protein [Planctomycetota bacterium]|nr:PA14 domain-containing protein [Planctomycetota bacterium]